MRRVLFLALGLLLAVPSIAHAAIRKQVSRDQITVRAFPDEFVIGNAFGGAMPFTMDVLGDQVLNYRWGFIYGTFQGCGYIVQSALVPKAGTARSQCAANTGSPRPRVTDFTNGEVKCLRRGNHKCDGVPRKIVCDTTQPYFNVRPWTSPTATSGLDPAPVLTRNRSFRFRYTAKGGYWALGRSPDISKARGAGKGWVFVPRTCVSNS